MMRTILCICLVSMVISLTACAQTKQVYANTDTRTISFPGAEGFGKYTKGGRGGKTFIVTNLNDHGPGSFREAAEAKLPRTIVFAISGTIHLESKLVIKENVTIAGQSAPGDGICLADYPVSLGGNNIIIRFIRFRMGDKNQKGGMVDGNGGDDAFGGNRWSHIMIDHCSMSWSTDECFSLYGGDSTTLQWNIISEPLHYSYHFEEGDKDYEHHGYGGIWGGSHLTAHHNLFAHCASRNPRFNGTRLGATQELVDYRNNVIYNWGNNNVYGGESGHYNIVGNYYKYGPMTNKSVRNRIVNPTRQDKPFVGYGQFFVDRNYVDEFREVNVDNTKGVHLSNGTEADKQAVLATKPFDFIAIGEVDAVSAYREVLDGAGVLFPARDTLDQRIVDDVKNRTGRFIDVQGGYAHGTEYEKTVNAWPALKSLPAPPDTDKDGIPDEWERAHNLNPDNAADSLTYTLQNGYTNLEVYLNSLVNGSKKN